MLDGGRDLEVSSFFVNHEFVILHKGDNLGKIILRNIFLRIKIHISTFFYIFVSGPFTLNTISYKNIKEVT